jgi:hypothetical protein
MRICGIDPGTDSPGFAVWDTVEGRHTYAGRVPPKEPVDVVIVECGWPHGPMGKLALWGLGWRACTQTLSVPLRFAPDCDQRFKITPDAWRVALGLNPSYPKDVCVNRLRLIRYRNAVIPSAECTADMIEACGVAEGGAVVLARRLKKDRKGLTAVTI